MSKHKVKLYFRHGCHLCEDMLQHLVELQQEIPFEVETVDIDTKGELQQRFGTLIPVLEAENRELCHYYLDEVALRNYLSTQVIEVS